MTERELEILQGTVQAVVYQNYENGYTVLRLNAETGQMVTVVGTIPLAIMGERLVVTGKWSNHASYGRQFEAEFLERLMPETTPEILSYLSSRTVKGIGPKLAARIVERFGSQTLAVIEQEPQRLAEVSGISMAKAREIGQSFRQQVGMRRLIEFLTLHHLPGELAVKLYRLYGEQAVELLYNDPYLLTESGLDADFALVDQFAISLGVTGDDPRRVEAGILFELSYNLTGGHAFLPVDKLVQATATLLSVEAETVESGVHRLKEAGRVEPDTLANIAVCYLPALYEAETYIAARLIAMCGAELPEPKDLSQMIRQAAGDGAVQYSDLQREAIETAATSKMMAVTGGPGTGKTTILKGILDLYHQMGLTVLLAAPTGRAAKRLSEVTGEPASTIHRLLEANIEPTTGNMVFFHDEDAPLRCDAVIVDEASMVDVLLMSSLLRAVPERARLILVGDPDQLPPVGPGFPFYDMLRSGAVPTVRLTEIFRQAQKSLIVTNAHKVNQGQAPELGRVDSDFFFLRRRSEQAVVQTVCELCSLRLPKNMGVAPEEIQVLSPSRKGSAGTVELNRALQNALNPQSPGKMERKRGDFSFREGDRVMQIRNNYDILWKKRDGSAVGAGVFNGDIGTIVSIDPEQETITVDFDEKYVEYTFDMLNELELAYAMTVHKSQGSEYRAVILAAWGGSPYLLTRSILYTAITRARQMLIIVGREEVVAAMTENYRKSRRYTGLKLRLQEKEA
ncbi:MAG: ATP-dependent RecD-like DNA helicase [Oscillospiraceae bacterium]|nr:ATP-dependent RecD-like DNA helicase [Oscillospiraceae bacterium]